MTRHALRYPPMALWHPQLEVLKCQCGSRRPRQCRADVFLASEAPKCRPCDALALASGTGPAGPH